MDQSPQKFGQLLSEAVYQIRRREASAIKKTLRLVQDELGYAVGREGGSAIEYWRKGNIPAKAEQVAELARELVRRGGLDRTGLAQFLASAGYSNAVSLAEELFPVPALERFAPFIIGPPISHPRQFFGREAELSRIFNLWKRFPLQNVAVIGPQRSGKTSLLHTLARLTTTPAAELRPGQRADWLSQPERYRWVFVDFQNAQLCRREPLFRYLLERLEISPPDPCDLNGFIDSLSRHLHQPAVIMMDEIGAGLAAPELDQEFWWSLRSLGSNYTEGRLGFILTAHDLPARLAQAQGKPSPFFNIFGHTLKLGPLIEPAARELLASSPRPFDPADVAWMLEQSGRWPILLQILGDTRLASLESGQPGDNWQTEALQRLEPFRHLLDDD
jgi:hypothetical protein